MRVVQLIDSLTVGGTERMAVNISNALSDSGHDVLLITTRKGGTLTEHLKTPVAYFNGNKKSSTDFFAFFRLFAKSKKFQPDVIHAHSSSVYWAVCLKAFMPKVKVVFHDHYGMSEHIKPKDRKWLRWLSRFVDYTIVVNQNLLTWNLKNTSVQASKIVFIRNFPYLNLPTRPDTKSREVSNFQLVCLANLRRQKDHFTLIEALKQVKDQGYSFYLKLVGSTFNDDYEAKIKLEIKQTQLEKQIEFTGAVNNVADILSQSDIGLLSSTSEGLSVSLLEYGLAGLPVVVTNVGQCGEVIEYGKFGGLVPPQRPDLLAEQIILILNDFDSAMRRGEQFKQHVLHEYGSKRFLKEYINLLNS